MKVIFFGTPLFAAEVLDYLLNQGVQIVGVITKPDRAQGRSSELVPTPVKTAARQWNAELPVFQPEIVSSPDFAPQLEKYQADLFVVVAYGEILKEHLLKMPRIACINLHASLLPKYRGAAPIQRCLINGERETGVTIMHMAKKMDAGDIIAMSKVTIEPEMTYGELETTLCKEGSRLLLSTIHDLAKGSATRTPQDHAQATFAPKIELEDCCVNWHQSAITIHNLVRGVNPNPGAWCWVDLKGQKKRLRILTTRVVSEGSTGTVGQISSSKEGFFIQCQVGQLRLLQVQLEGKRTMTAEEFIKGFSKESLSILC